MKSVFNLEELQSLLRDFYHITSVRITVFDTEMNELVSYPEKCAPFCALIRETREGLAACARCDRTACTTAVNRNKTYIYRCHAGLTEAVTPLFVGRVLVGYLIFGHAFAYNSVDEGWDVIQKCCEKYPVDLLKLKASCEACPHLSEEYIQSAARILHATASYLVLERMATLQEDSVAARLDDYLSKHFTEDITTHSLCQTLDIGRSRLYTLSKQLYGCGILQQIIKLRMEQAKHLLIDYPEMSIAQIAAECGYPDYNYFIAVFSRTVGQAPNAFRKQAVFSRR